MALTTVSSINVVANIANALNLGTNGANLSTTFSLSTTDGTAAGNANDIFWDHRTLAASASETLDLVGSLTSPLGTTISAMVRIKVLLVSADASNTNNVQVLGAGSNGLATFLGSATDYAIVRPGATLAWIAGAADATCYTVNPSTAHLLQVANGGAGTSVSYTVVVIGANA